jgi:IclR family transcriptional regulator, acetate operon repressor
MNPPSTTLEAPRRATADAGGTRIQSVARASQLLLWVAQQSRGASAKEIAEAQGLALPTTYHLLNTLIDQGLLAKGSDRRYILGRGTAILAHAYLRGKAVPDSLLAGVRELARRTEETAYLADWGEHEIRVLASVEGSQILRVADIGTGSYEHAHARANGKVLLAYAPLEVRQAYLRAHPLVPLTENTITDPRELEKELEGIRRRGCAYDDEEFAVGVSCVGAPLLLDGHLIAALGMSVPTERFKKRRAELTTELLDVIDSLRVGVESPETAED